MPWLYAQKRRSRAYTRAYSKVRSYDDYTMWPTESWSLVKLLSHFRHNGEGYSLPVVFFSTQRGDMHHFSFFNTTPLSYCSFCSEKVAPRCVVFFGPQQNAKDQRLVYKVRQHFYLVFLLLIVIPSNAEEMRARWGLELWLNPPLSPSLKMAVHHHNPPLWETQEGRVAWYQVDPLSKFLVLVQTLLVVLHLLRRWREGLLLHHIWVETHRNLFRKGGGRLPWHTPL